jgi:hypothetical protein
MSSFAAPRGNVVLIGDARATVTPSLGQVRNGMQILQISYCKILSFGKPELGMQGCHTCNGAGKRTASVNKCHLQQKMYDSVRVCPANSAAGQGQT